MRRLIDFERGYRQAVYYARLNGYAARAFWDTQPGDFWHEYARGINAACAVIEIPGSNGWKLRPEVLARVA